MIVFDYDICPTLILAAVLGEVLRFAMDVHICVYNRHLYMVSCEITPICRGMCLLKCKRIKEDGSSSIRVNFSARVFRADLLSQPWDILKGLFDPNEMWLKWKALFLNVCDAHAPLKSKRLRLSKSSWITTRLKKRLNYRDHLKKKAVKSNSLNDWNQYRILKNQINNEIKIAKQDYHVNAFNKFSGDTRKTWQTIIMN